MMEPTPFPPMSASRSGTKASSTVLSKRAAGIGCRADSGSSPPTTERNSDNQNSNQWIQGKNRDIHGSQARSQFMYTCDAMSFH